MFIGNQIVTGSLTVTGTITGNITGSASTASYVEYTNVANKPAIVSGSSQISFNGITDKPTLVSGSSQITYSGLTGIPSGILSGSAQIASFGIFATTGSNQFNGNQSITGSLTVSGQVVAQTLNVQQVTSSIVYSSGSNIFGNTLGNTQQFTGSVGVTGSLTVAGAGTFSNFVGINGSPGTSFPLEVYTNSSTTYTTSSRGNVMRVYNSNTAANIFAGIELGGAGTANDGLVGINGVVTGSGNGAMTFYTRNSNTFSEKLRLDSAGNLGLGVTPSAWSLGKAIEIGNIGNAVWSVSATQYNILLNAYYNGGYVYASSNPASYYQQASGAHAWYIAPSGTAGDAISFTSAMTLDASGRLGIGTTSPLVSLHVGNGNQSAINGASNKIHIATTGTRSALVTLANSSGGTTVEGQFESSAETADLRVIIGSTSNHPVAFRANNSEAMRITPSGSVGIGTNTPTNGKVEIQQSTTTAALWVQTGGTTSASIIADFRTGTNLPALQILGDGTATFGSNITANGFKSYSGTSSIASGATSTIHTMSANGLYTVQVIVNAGSLIYSAAAIFIAHNSNAQYVKTIDLYDGPNVTLDNSGSAIQITNGGFSTFTWNWSILFQPF